MLITFPLKLETTKEQKQALLATFYRFNSACDFISQWAFENKVFNNFKIHKEIYSLVREKFNLPSQFAIRAIAKVANSYKTDKKHLHKFHKRGAVDYDQRLLSLKDIDNINLSSLSGRLRLPSQYGNHINLKENKIKNSAKLVYKNGSFYLNISVEVDETSTYQTTDFIGVDLGIVNLAATSDGVIFSGGEVENVRKRYQKLKSQLQQKRTRSAKRKLKRVSGKERNFKKNTNHVISKKIVRDAQKALKGIGLEDLENFKKTVRKEQRDKFGKWAFGELLGFIEYKAKIAGVSVVKVDPRNTSRTCPSCGFCDKKNRKTQSNFVCLKCGYENHADVVGAINISKRAAVNPLNVAGSFGADVT